MIGIPQALVLLDLHDDAGHSTARPERLEMLVAGGVIAEIHHQGRLKRSGELYSVVAGRQPSRMLELAEQTIGGRPSPLSELILRITDLDLRHMVHSDLVGRGALKVERKRRFLWFKRSVWPTADPTIERELLEHLRAYAGAPSEELTREDSLFALADVGELLPAIFDEPVDVSACIRKCPVGKAVRAMFAEQTHRLDHN